MRYFEISSGIRLPVNEEEQSILDRVADGNKLSRSELSEREQEVARLMVSRGLLRRKKDDNGTFFIANDMADIWRN